MKIAIFGAGAIGGYIGAQLSFSENDVSLIARGAHLEAIQENGLKLLIDGEEKVAKNCFATDDPKEVGAQDFIIVALKAHQAYESAERLKPMLGPDTHVVTAQNGIPWWYFYRLDGPYEGHRLESVDPGSWQWNIVGPERCIGCVVYPATEIIEPGSIKHKYGNKFTIGEPDGTISERCDILSKIMETSGLRAPIRENIRDDIWKKLWGNLCFNPISALTGATLDIIATNPGTRILARSMMMEAQEVGEKLGVDFRIDIHRRINGAADVGAHKTSMLQDLEKGRAMEIDALVTAVQEMGDLVSVETPFIDSILALIQQKGRVVGTYPTYPEAGVALEGHDEQRID